jgi:large subunit ribosomal protein L40e
VVGGIERADGFWGGVVLLANVFIFPPYFQAERDTMARFKEADARLLNKMICMNCYARNAPKATRCRKCGYTNLRAKAKESRKT